MNTELFRIVQNCSQLKYKVQRMLTSKLNDTGPSDSIMALPSISDIAAASKRKRKDR